LCFIIECSLRNFLHFSVILILITFGNSDKFLGLWLHLTGFHVVDHVLLGCLVDGDALHFLGDFSTGVSGDL